MQANIVSGRMSYFTIVFQTYFLAENAEERLLVYLHERTINRLPQTIFGLEDVLQTRVLLQGLRLLDSLPVDLVHVRHT